MRIPPANCEYKEKATEGSGSVNITIEKLPTTKKPATTVKNEDKTTAKPITDHLTSNLTNSEHQMNISNNTSGKGRVLGYTIDPQNHS